MRKLAKRLVGHMLARTGLMRRLIGEAGVVVAFHRVNDDIQDGLTSSVADFERYCDFFRRRFSPIPLSEFLDRMEKGESLAGKLSITFDDGYRDNYLNAAPVLKALDLPATFFIASEFMSSEHIAWWDQDLDPAPRWMSWKEVSDLAAMGFEIGAHTRTHADLGAVVEEKALDEVRGSKTDLEARIGSSVTLFAYPYGRAENLLEENRSMVRDVGFRCCASCHGGLVRPGDDPYRLNRVPISDWFDSPDQFAFAASLNRV
jgi:peptidoglycan/xylan/chitin deacetylase (PgdA/CDA1 family)